MGHWVAMPGWAAHVVQETGRGNQGRQSVPAGRPLVAWPSPSFTLMAPVAAAAPQHLLSKPMPPQVLTARSAWARTASRSYWQAQGTSPATRSPTSMCMSCPHASTSGASCMVSVGPGRAPAGPVTMATPCGVGWHCRSVLGMPCACPCAPFLTGRQFLLGFCLGRPFPCKIFPPATWRTPQVQPQAV